MLPPQGVESICISDMCFSYCLLLKNMEDESIYIIFYGLQSVINIC